MGFQMTQNRFIICLQMRKITTRLGGQIGKAKGRVDGIVAEPVNVVKIQFTMQNNSNIPLLKN